MQYDGGSKAVVNGFGVMFNVEVMVKVWVADAPMETILMRDVTVMAIPRAHPSIGNSSPSVTRTAQ